MKNRFEQLFDNTEGISVQGYNHKRQVIVVLSDQALLKIKKVIAQMDNISSQTDKLNSSGQQQEQILIISNDISNVAEISKESEQSASEIERSCKELDQFAQDLKEMVSLFTLHE